VKRNQNQQKFVLSDEEKATLNDALIIAYNQLVADANTAYALGDQFVGQSCADRAAEVKNLLTYAPEVVRVAVTVEAPSVGLYVA